MNLPFDDTTLLIAAAVSVMIYAIGALLLPRRDSRVELRVADLARIIQTIAPAETPESPRSQWFSLLVQRMFPRNSAQSTRLQQRLLHSGYVESTYIYIFLLAKLVLTAAPLVLAAALFASHLLNGRQALSAGITAALAGSLIPGLWLNQRKKRRLISLSKSLPDFLDLIVTCVQSGLSLNGALQRVTSELCLAHPLLSYEMDRVQREIELGATPETALRNFAERSDFEPVAQLASIVQQSRRFGTGIVEALRIHVEALRQQREDRAEKLAQMATVKILFPTLLCILPGVFVIMAGPAAIKVNEVFASPDAVSTPSARGSR